MAQTAAAQLCLEIAAFVASKDVSVLQRAAHDVLRSYPGFIASLALVSTKDALSGADVVLWASHEDAVAAANAFPADERVLPYTSCIASMSLFGHYTNVSLEQFTALKEAPFVELAAFKTLPEHVSKARAAVQATLKGNDGVVVVADATQYTAKAHTDTATHDESTPSTPTAAGVDVIGWTSVEAHNSGPAFVLEKRPDLSPFFEPSAFENIALFQLYKHV